MSLTGGDMCPVLAKAAEQARIPSSCGMFVYRDETSNVPMIAVRGSVFFFFQFPQKIWGVVDVRWDLGNKGFEETINEQGDAFSR